MNKSKAVLVTFWVGLCLSIHSAFPQTAIKSPDFANKKDVPKVVAEGESWSCTLHPVSSASMTDVSAVRLHYFPLSN